MKKRVLSLFLTFVLSFSMMPMSAFAEGTGAVAEQEAQSSGDTAYVSITGEDVSGGDAANEDASNKDTAVEAAQALIDALPEEVTAENADELQAQLMAIDEALAELSEEQAAGLDMTRYEKICAALNAPALVAEQDGVHTEADHASMTEWTETDSLPNTAGSYYLTQNVKLTEAWEVPQGDITLCLNGKSITLDAEGAVIDMQVYGTIFTLYDCIGTGTITHGMNDDTKYQGGGVAVSDGTFNMYGGTIIDNIKGANNYGGGVAVYRGTFNMYNGKIINNATSDNGYGGGGVYVSRGTFNMYDGEISGNTALGEGGGILLADNSTFIMTDGSISKNVGGDTNYGGGICVSYGSTFTMKGGDVIGNKSGKGGGVYVLEAETTYGKNTFHMDGGTITGNTATTTGYQPGGGVYVPSDGIFTMSGAVKITDNTNNGVQNNIYLFNNTITITGALDKDASIGVTTLSVANVGSPVTIAKGDGYTLTDDDADRFTSDKGYHPVLDGDEVKLYKNPPQKHPICGETCTHGGRHPALVWEGITELADATKAGNYYLMNSVTRPEETGPLFCSNEVNLCLNGCSITAEHDSCTIMVKDGANLTLTDCKGDSGTITHGSGNTGSGVMVNSGGSFTMYGGTICGNTAADSGSGVIVNGGSRFTMYGGAITGNNTTGEVSCGGVYVASNGTFTVSGAAKIQKNWRNGTLQDGVYVQGSGTASNVGLTPDTTITIVEGLTEEACIGVSKRLPLTKADNISMAAGATEELDYKKIFPLDVNDSYYSVIRDGAGNLSIHLHEHGWKYQLSEDGATVTAVCNAAATCPTDGGNGGSVTLKAPAADALTYDGTAKSVTLDGSFVEDVKTPTEVDVTYRVKDGDALEGAPVNAGTYTASITCIGADDISVTASVEYTIEKATLTAGDFTVTPPANLVYDGEAKYATVSSTKINGNYIYVEYEDANGTLDQATKAGTYNVLVTAKGDPNYNEVNQLQDPAWTFTIQKAKPVIQLTAARQTLVKNGKEVDISKWATFNNNDSDAKLTYELVDAPTDITLTGNMLKAEKADDTATPFQIRVTAEATDNFEAPDEKIITVIVVNKMGIGIVFENMSESPTVTYGDSDFSLTAALTRTVPDDDNGTWSWSSSDDSVLEIVSGADTATPTMKVKKAGGSQLIVTYTSDTYSGSAGVYITVAPKEVTADMIADIPAQEYAARNIEPAPEVKDGTVTLISGTDFTYSYSDNFNAGTATLTITGTGNYTGTADKTFTISPKSINGAVIELEADSFAYTGTEQMVNIASVKLEGWSAAITYKIVGGAKATNANDSITLTISGRGNYTGTATTTWKITRIDPKPADFDVTPGLPAALTYDGSARTVNVKEKDGINGMGNVTVKYNGSIQAPMNAGSYVVTFDVDGGINYNARTGLEAGTLTINKAAAPTLADRKVNCKYTLTGGKTVDLADLVAGATGYTLGETVGNTGIISDASVDATGTLKYTLTGKGSIGDTVTLPVTITSVNYEDATVNVVITMAAKDDQAPLSITGDNTVVYGKMLTLGTIGGSGTGKVTYSIDEANSTGKAVIEGNILTPVKVGSITVKATKAEDADYYEATSAAFVITITQATPTGEPKYTVVTADGKTLADAGLTLTGSTLNPAVGTLEWIDDAGNVLPNDTKVEVNKNYKWRFVPADDNYTALTGEITLYPVYWIMDGADGSWNQSTDGSGSLSIRGNGAFSKFVDVKVDGNVVDPMNYTAREGSTIIELHADYLKTLSEGSHTFEIAWTDGTASTGFTVAKNTSGNDDTGNNGNDDSNKDSSNDSSNNNSGSNNTAGSGDNTAQTLTGSPNTGDASGLWILLFAVSAAGLAVMLVRRKKQ